MGIFIISFWFYFEGNSEESPNIKRILRCTSLYCTVLYSICTVQVGSSVPGAELPVPRVWHSGVRPAGPLLLLPLLHPGQPQVGPHLGHLRQGVLPPCQPDHLLGSAGLRAAVSGGLVLECRLGGHNTQHLQ